MPQPPIRGPYRMSPQNPLSGRMSLTQRSLRGGAWTFVGFGLGQTIRFGSNLLLTRLLVPDMFGLVAIAYIFIAGLYMFSDVGLRPVIIRSKRGDDPTFLNTVWVLQIIRGLLLWFIAIGISVILFIAGRLGMMPKDTVYADPRLPFVVAGVSISLIIVAFNSTKLYESYRRLELGRVTLVEFYSQIGNLLCIFTWILIDRSIWALVAGNIGGSLVTMLLSHVWLHGTSNRWQFQKTAFREVFHFGKWIFVSSVLTFLVSNGDRLILGGLVTPTVLGVSMIAYMIVGAIEQSVIKIITSVLFPVVSEIVRERPHTLQANYYRMHVVVAGFCYFCSGVLMISGQSLIELLYDRRYADAGWMLEILAAAMLTYPLQIAIGSFTALGMPKLQSHILGIRLILLVIAMPTGFHLFGLPGALWGSVASQFLCIPITAFYSSRHGFFSVPQELFPLPMVLVGAGIGKIMAALIRNYHGV